MTERHRGDLPPRQQIDFAQLLRTSNARAESYRELIKRSGSSALDIGFNFSSPWSSESYKQERDFLRTRLAGQTLVDLGSNKAELSGFAREMGVEEYVSVDIRHMNWNANDPEIKVTTIESEGLRNVRVGDDMLDFVARLPDGSVSFTINGITPVIISNREYHEALAKEMLRAMSSDGVIFAASSYPVSDFLSDDANVDRHFQSSLKSFFGTGEDLIKILTKKA